ncbi:hypothetical protein [Picosynechococcus sp. PCC 8807]|uniref:hypothetical protein n=1 Tax=Picosynechococcus sp. PCC 8807 TaxID=195248 RepID=UPI000810A56E|nr:hypothetical protein [Picosynechococcus sp. PCC 8807]ANV90509.1 hypothetical protein AWQ24_07650 [Picosynechococcus sp. PCC 8807]
METFINLNQENQEKLQYIQEKTHQNIESSIITAIEIYFKQLKTQEDPLARLKQSPLIASFEGDADLSEKCEEIFHNFLENQ